MSEDEKKKKEVQNEDELTRRAREELLRESQLAAVRVETVGTQGWLKPKMAKTNKRFLRQTILSTLHHRPPSAARNQSKKRKVDNEEDRKDQAASHSNKPTKSAVRADRKDAANCHSSSSCQ